MTRHWTSRNFLTHSGPSQHRLTIASAGLVSRKKVRYAVFVERTSDGIADCNDHKRSVLYYCKAPQAEQNSHTDVVQRSDRPQVEMHRIKGTVADQAPRRGSHVGCAGNVHVACDRKGCDVFDGVDGNDNTHGVIASCYR